MEDTSCVERSGQRVSGKKTFSEKKGFKEILCFLFNNHTHPTHYQYMDLVRSYFDHQHKLSMGEPRLWPPSIVRIPDPIPKPLQEYPQMLACRLDSNLAAQEKEILLDSLVTALEATKIFLNGDRNAWIAWRLHERSLENNRVVFLSELSQKFRHPTVAKHTRRYLRSKVSNKYYTDFYTKTGKRVII